MIRQEEVPGQTHPVWPVQSDERQVHHLALITNECLSPHIDQSPRPNGMFFRGRLDNKEHHEAGNRGESDPTPREPERGEVAGHSQYRPKHRCRAIFGRFEHRVPSVVINGGDGVDLFRRDDLGNVVVHHGFQTVLGLFEEAWRRS